MKMLSLSSMENVNVVAEHENIYILYIFSQILLGKIMNYNGREDSNFLKQEKRELNKMGKKWT